MIDLDANFLVAVLRKGPRASRLLEQWLQRHEVIAMSVIAWSQFLCGPLTNAEPERAQVLVNRIEPFTAEDAVLAAELFNATGRRQRSHSDCMIAASAIGRGSALATFDRAGFARFRRFQLQLQLA